MLNIKGILIAVTACMALTGCYVVPAQPRYQTTQPVPAVVVTPAPRPVFTARLYPVNDVAASMGRITGTISNPERGHGEFAFTAGNESFSGEATRDPGSSKGRANATGNRGGFAQCEYSMSSASLGTGSCTFSGGARFDLHVSL